MFNKDNEEILRTLVKETILNLINFLKSLDEKQIKNTLVNYNPYRVIYEIEEGFPRSASYRTSLADSYSLSRNLISKMLGTYISSTEFRNTRKQLIGIHALMNGKNELLEPMLDLFSFCVIIIMEKLFTSETFHVAKNIKKVQFDETIFKTVFDSMMKNWARGKIGCKYYYVIRGPFIMNKNFKYNETLDNYFIIPDNSEIEKFIESFRFSRTFHHGLAQIGVLIYNLGRSSAWIKGNYKVTYPDLGSEGIYVTKEKNLVPPEYIREAFYLLTGEKVEVEFVSIPNEYDLRNLTIYPRHDGLHHTIGFYREPFYPSWMERSFSLFNESIIDLDEEEISFIQFYPLFRMTIEQKSIEKLVFDRFTRLMQFGDPKDIIIESFIIFETLLTSEAKELGFQLRVKLAIILAKSKPEKKFIQEIVKILYDARSRIVHSGGHEESKRVKNLGGITKLAELIKRMVRLFLLRTLVVKDNDFNLIKRDHLEEILDDFMIGEKTEISSNKYFDKQLEEFYSDIKRDSQLNNLLEKYQKTDENH